MAGKLSVVATPIGNLEDITLRALRILKEADFVACEDTRVTKKLLSHFDIHTPAVTLPNIVRLLGQGKHVALVSDAGTPGVSDPGLEIVSKVRELGNPAAKFPFQNGLAERSEENRGPFGKEISPEVYQKIQIEAIPGPSALAAAISIAGLKAPSFTFYGFLPQKKGREKLIKAIAIDERASIFYESPHRITKLLEALVRAAPERRMGLFRELTKVYEEALIGRAGELLQILLQDPQKQRGEFVVIVESR